MKKAFKLFMLILIGAAFSFNFASCDDISFTYRRHQDKDKGGSQSLPSVTLYAGDIFWNQYEDVYLEVNSYGNIDFYYWDVDTYSYESLFSNAYYNINNSDITITCSYYDYKGNYYTDTFTGNFDGTTMTLFEDGYFWLTFTKVTSVPHAKLNVGDIFWDQYEDVYLKVNSDGNIDFYGWNEETYSYESILSNGNYTIDNSVITITYSYYDGNYHTVTFTGNFDGTTMTLFDENGYQCLTLTKVTSLNAGDIFMDQDEEVYLKVNSDGNIDFYYWNVDTYSYEKYVSNAHYNIENSEITITCSYYEGNYYTDTLTGNFDGITMTLFDENGHLYLASTKVPSVQRSFKTATNFSTITLEDNWPYNNHAMIEWIASDNKYKLNAGQKIKFTIRGFTYDDITVNKTKFTAALVDTTPYANSWIELSDYVNAQDGTMLDYGSYFEAVFIIELTSTPSNASAEACKFELSVGDENDTQDDITIYVSAFEAELLE